MNAPTELGFSSNGRADAQTVAEFRNAFAQWLRENFALDPERFNDVLLAVNEALTNSAEFAYVGRADGGTMSVTARYNAEDRRLVTTVADQGAWLHKEPDGTPNTRGRGIELMRALSDRATIDRTPTGTQVRLEFDGCPLLSQEPFATSA
ncbi:Histidine kinase-like ATPase domain-containing protein [Mycolicibacterium rutilum]|uniref:Histidine kinase-like ATPase domain-containing protein n=1 Tax=Mycolicibacterium rutilum TaxID=370526 RepID=A0A1H6K6R4_MYCRU|nr:ATP-binding protein [Mycolicibacterium rutilum]SEH67484.1 Histidine kinase-like ATPase domain-containing protein [Mycolicibacterium rutilum]